MRFPMVTRYTYAIYAFRIYSRMGIFKQRRKRVAEKWKRLLSIYPYRETRKTVSTFCNFDRPHVFANGYLWKLHTKIENRAMATAIAKYPFPSKREFTFCRRYNGRAGKLMKYLTPATPSQYPKTTRETSICPYSAQKSSYKR